MILTLEEAKRHLRVDDGFHEDDVLIEELIGLAEEDIAHKLKYDSLAERFPDGNYPLTVKQAAKLIVAHYYENREPVAFASSSNVPMMIDSLLFPYVRYREKETTTVGDGPIKIEIPTLKSMGIL